jgi:hypothetical protein
MSSVFLSYAGYPAVDYVIQASQGYAKLRGVLVNHVMYVLAVSSKSNSFPNFDRYVNSLQFTN